jgi:hypothetical protein
MKLRIRGDSVRLRLTRSEVARLADGATVEEATHFPGGTVLRYALLSRAGAASVGAGFAAGLLTVEVPEHAARHWATTETVEIRAEVPFDGGVLTVLVEKDFPCLTTRPGEDDSDAFQPGETRTRC